MASSRTIVTASTGRSGTGMSESDTGSTSDIVVVSCDKSASCGERQGLAGIWKNQRKAPEYLRRSVQLLSKPSLVAFYKLTQPYGMALPHTDAFISVPP
jgi:hypothetical protein